MRSLRWCLLLTILLLPAVSGFAQAADEAGKEEAVPGDRITIQELKRKMDAGEKMVILDARKGSAWIGSVVKIKGAIHCTNDDLEARIPDLPKEQEIIVYCA